MKQEIRQQVLERDNYTCQRCGTKNRLHTHHKISRRHGGTDSLDNVTTLCIYCHRIVEPPKKIGPITNKYFVCLKMLRIAKSPISRELRHLAIDDNTSVTELVVVALKEYLIKRGKLKTK